MLFLEEDDEKSFYLRVHRKSRIAMATEACESHSQNEFLAIQRTCLPSRSLMWANSQAPSADTASCLQHPSPDLPIFPPAYSNSPFKYSPSSNIHNLTCVHLLSPTPAPIPHPPSLLSSQIMVLTDPEFESSVLISSDEGASFQKYRLTFYVLSLLFHPTEEDWALAYSHDQKVRLTLWPHVTSSFYALF